MRTVEDLQNPKEAFLAPQEPTRLGAWGSDAVKVGVFGDMGTAEVDGTFDAGHSNEPPSIRTVGILKQHLRGGAAAAVAREASGGGDGGLSEGEIAGGAEPQLGLVLHIGDLSYARGYDAQWDEVSERRAVFWLSWAHGARPACFCFLPTLSLRFRSG